MKPIDPKQILFAVLFLYAVAMSYLYGADSELRLAIDGFHAAEQARTILTECVDVGERARRATLSWSGDLREILVHLDRIPPAPVVVELLADR